MYVGVFLDLYMQPMQTIILFFKILIFHLCLNNVIGNEICNISDVHFLHLQPFLLLSYGLPVVYLWSTCGLPVVYLWSMCLYEILSND